MARLDSQFGPMGVQKQSLLQSLLGRPKSIPETSKSSGRYLPENNGSRPVLDWELPFIPDNMRSVVLQTFSV